MPRSHHPRSIPSAPSNTSHRRQREQIIDKANTLLSTAGKGRLSAGVYLSQNMSKALLLGLFKDFEADPISHKSTVDLATGTQSTEAALRSMTDLATVMATLEGASPEEHNPQTAPFVTLVSEILLERWNEVARWITFFVEYIPQSLDHTTWEKVMRGCLQVVDPVFVLSGGNSCMCQIASLPSTIDLTIGFLCLQNPSTGRPSHVTGIASTCAICSLFASAGTISVMGSATMTLRLTSLDSPATSKLLQCILQRIQDALPATKTAGTIEIAARDLAHLIYGLQGFLLSNLRREFGQGCILSEATRVAAEVVKNAVEMEIRNIEFWFSIGESIGNLIRLSKPASGKIDRSVEVILEAGIIPPLLLSLPHCMDPSFPRRLDEPAQDLLYWLLDSRLFVAAQKGGLHESFFHDLQLKDSQSPQGGKVVKSMHSAFKFALLFCEVAFGSGKAIPVRMCCSLKHSSPIRQSEDMSHLKVCARCNSAVYCSKACQREDWLAFHAKECLQAVHARRQLKEAAISVRYRRDRLTLLVGVVNKFLPDLRSLRQQQRFQGMPLVRTDVGSHILAFDFTGVMLRLVNSLTSYIEDTLTHFFRSRTIEPYSQARVLQCAREVKLSPNTLVLVAGTFIDRQTLTTICVKMQYFTDAADGEKYKVVSTVCSVILRSSLPPRNEADGKLWEELGRR